MRILRSALGFLLLIGMGCSEGNRQDRETQVTEPFIDPWSFGPYAVGVRHALYFDSTRPALNWRGCGDPPCPRPIPVSYWYPAEASPGAHPLTLAELLGVTEGTLTEILRRVAEEQGFDFSRFRVEIGDVPLKGVLNAPLRRGQYPLVIFSHGAGGVRFQNLFETEYLASHGYVVLALDHEGDATVTIISGEIVTVDTRRFVASSFKRPLDVEFLISLHEELNRDPRSWLYQSLNGKIGLTGHSFGAYTSIIVANRDERIGAIVPMAAPGIPSLSRRIPTLFMIGGEDDTIDQEGNEGVEAAYDLILPPKGLLNLLDAGHFTFTNMCDIIPDFGDGCGKGTRITDGSPLEYVTPAQAHAVVNGFTTAWFGLYLKEDPRYAVALRNPRIPPDVRLEFRWIP